MPGLTYSVSEISAFGGTRRQRPGLPLAQAQMFGQAAVRHLVQNGPTAPLLAALVNPPNRPALRLPLLTKDILRALPLAEPELSLTLHPGDEPLALAYARLLPLEFDRLEVIAPSEGQAQLRMSAHPAASLHKLPPRLMVPSGLYETFSELALRTYVPSTAQNRAVGAGAGATDQD